MFVLSELPNRQRFEQQSYSLPTVPQTPAECNLPLQRPAQDTNHVVKKPTPVVKNPLF